MFEYFKPQTEKFQMKEMEEERNRVKMCYAFATSKKFLYQELSVINPNAHIFDGVHIMPTDIYAYTYESWAGKKINSLEEIFHLVTALETDIVCIGSHDSRYDRTIQLISLAKSTKDIRKSDLMLLQFLIPLSIKEKQNIIKTLKDEYRDLSAVLTN